MALSVNIEKKLGNFHLKVEFEGKNEILSILGASGCGKSMTLKCIAGIEKPDKGSIVLDGITLFDSEKKINLPPQKRKVGYLFQQYALFPNMTVEQNIACGVRDKNRKNEVVASMIKAMNLEGMEKKKPDQLSGGQQQRVALARILANEPEVLLLDEPFSALDSHLRFQIEQEVHELMRSFGKTVILVSHDRDEVFRLSDSIAIMHDGTMETVGEKKEVFHDPKTRNGAILTGCKNISEVEILDENYIYAKDWDFELYAPNLRCHGIRSALPLAGPVRENIKYAGIRMHDIELSNEDTRNNFDCDVKHVIENPFSYTIMVCPKGKESKKLIGVELEKHIWESIEGTSISIQIPPDAILLLKE